MSRSQVVMPNLQLAGGALALRGERRDLGLRSVPFQAQVGAVELHQHVARSNESTFDEHACHHPTGDLGRHPDLRRLDMAVPVNNLFGQRLGREVEVQPVRARGYGNKDNGGPEPSCSQATKSRLRHQLIFFR